MTPEIQKSILRACSRFISKRLEPIQKKLEDIEQKTISVESSFNFSSPAGQKTQEQIAQAVARSMDKAALRGEKGEPGRDADPVAVPEIAAELLATDGLKALVDLHVAEAVAKYFEENPVQNGKDGERGEPGQVGAQGEKGMNGADGVGLAGAVINRAGELVVTKTNGEAITLGLVIGKDGEKGQDGKDGVDLTDVTFDFDGDRGLIIRSKDVEVVKRLPIPIDRGYWREGMTAEKGDVLTKDGSAWIALQDNATNPGHDQKDNWRMLARKGRDGRDGVDKTPRTPEPVKLGNDNG